MKVLLRTLFVALLCSAGGGASAAVCGPDRAQDIPYLEDLKAAFLKADYRGFAELAGPYFPDLVERLNDYFGQVMVVFPNGFTSCETILQRREAPGFHQELVFLYPSGSPAPVALLIVAAEARGEIRLVEFNFNTSISDVLSDLK